MFNNMMLKKICGTKRREVTGGFRTVQVIGFIWGQGSLYMVELYQHLRLQCVLLVGNTKRWFDIVIVPVVIECKSDDTLESLYVEIEQ
jgi:hypothetical protein